MEDTLTARNSNTNCLLDGDIQTSDETRLNPLPPFPSRSASKSKASGPMPEEDLFDKDGHLFLSARESCRLAFKYQNASFPDDTESRLENGLDVRDAEGGANESVPRGARTGHLLEDRGESGEKVLKISLVAVKDNWPADVREVAVRFGPLVVDRTFRFYQVRRVFQSYSVFFAVLESKLLKYHPIKLDRV